MGQFRYRAHDGGGQAYSKIIEAESLHAATEQLRSQEIDVIAIEGIETGPRRLEPEGMLPPPVPRDVPVRISDMTGGWVMALVGAIFTGVALILVIVGIGMLIAGEGEGVFFTLFPMVHLSVGLGLLGYVLRQRSKRQRIYRDGDVVMARVDGVGYNRSVRVNGRNPYELAWSFDLNGHRYNDKQSSFDEQVMGFGPGDRLWVIYDPQDPETSVPWPPLQR